MSDVWDRQDNETGKAFEAFTLYRNLPPGERSIERVARELGKSGTLIGRWSSKHGWVDRTAAFDAQIDAITQINVAESRAAVQKQMLTTGQALIAAAGVLLRKIDQAKPEAAPAMARAGKDLVQIALGEPTEIVTEQVVEIADEGVTEVRDNEVLSVLAELGLAPGAGGEEELAVGLHSKASEAAERATDGVPASR